MADKGAFEAIDRTLKDIGQNNKLMGGVTFLLSGDFRHTLSVISRATAEDESNAGLKNSYIFKDLNFKPT